MITADSETLLRQASDTAHEYLLKAVRHIDDQFGKGYAKAHPELVAAFMDVAAKDFNNAVFCKALQEASDTLADAVRRVEETIETCFQPRHENSAIMVSLKGTERE